MYSIYLKQNQTQRARQLAIQVISVATIVVSMLSCQNTPSEDPVYLKSVEDWHQNRLDRLTRPIGWTTLSGLEWLPEGRSTFGASDTCDIILTERAPALVGYWEVHGDSVVLVPAADVILMRNDSLFTGGEVTSDKDGDADLFNSRSLYWSVIYRGGQYAVRSWDTLSADRHRVDSIPRYPVDAAYALVVTVDDPEPGDSVVVDNALGFTQSMAVAGYVNGRIRDTDFRITALAGGPGRLFLIFSDLTTDIETYSGGRYIYIDRPDSTGKSSLDFNLSYNPPCVFTAYATCLLPPKENFIAAHVRAGEKDFSMHH